MADAKRIGDKPKEISKGEALQYIGVLVGGERGMDEWGNVVTSTMQGQAAIYDLWKESTNKHTDRSLKTFIADPANKDQIESLRLLGGGPYDPEQARRNDEMLAEWNEQLRSGEYNPMTGTVTSNDDSETGEGQESEGAQDNVAPGTFTRPQGPGQPSYVAGAGTGAGEEYIEEHGLDTVTGSGDETPIGAGSGVQLQDIVDAHTERTEGVTATTDTQQISAGDMSEIMRLLKQPDATYNPSPKNPSEIIAINDTMHRLRETTAGNADIDMQEVGRLLKSIDPSGSVAESIDMQEVMHTLKNPDLFAGDSSTTEYAYGMRKDLFDALPEDVQEAYRNEKNRLVNDLPVAGVSREIFDRLPLDDQQELLKAHVSDEDQSGDGYVGSVPKAVFDRLPPDDQQSIKDALKPSDTGMPDDYDDSGGATAQPSFIDSGKSEGISGKDISGRVEDADPHEQALWGKAGLGGPKFVDLGMDAAIETRDYVSGQDSDADEQSLWGRIGFGGKGGKKKGVTTTTTYSGGATGSVTDQGVYTVARGDSLAGIAKRFNTTVGELAEWNDMDNPDLINIGQQISIVDPAAFEDQQKGASVSPEDVKDVFSFLGLDEPTDKRVEKIVGQIADGERNLLDVRNDLMKWMANNEESPYKDQYGSTRDVAEHFIRKIFEEEGATIATAKETEEVRINRLIDEVLADTGSNHDEGRHFADIRRGIREGMASGGGTVIPVEDDSELVSTPGDGGDEPTEDNPPISDETEDDGGGVGADPRASQGNINKVHDVFSSLDLNAPDDERANKIALELDAGTRTEIDVRNDLMNWMAYDPQSPYKDQFGSIEDVAEHFIRKIFEEEGATIATTGPKGESEQDRISRLVTEALSGNSSGDLDTGRGFEDIRRGIREGMVASAVEDAMEEVSQDVLGDTTPAPASTADQVKDIFKFLGLAAPSESRANSIASEIDNDNRTLIDVRNDLMNWMAYDPQSPYKDQFGSIEDVAEHFVRKVFAEEGATIATDRESEQKRIDRLVGDVLEGNSSGNLDTGRPFDDIRKGIRGENTEWGDGSGLGANDDVSASTGGPMIAGGDR